MQKRKYLTGCEVEKILQTIRHNKYHSRDYCLFQMSYLHGLRVSEAKNLLVSDIDLPGRSIYIRRLKNSLSTQHPLFDEELPSLKEWLRNRQSWAGAGSDWLFLSQKGGPLSRQQIRQMLLNYGASCGIRSNPHMLRHACGFALANMGKDTRLIQDYLGHKNIRHTVLYTATNARRFSEIWDCL
ncbi:tyrosine-type DNA invertase [Enterobacter wuhouensis]|uniref:tyrosine-type DNA invertase n=1 Tax=Enterobacter wuhouensis TaxID=2529381 RepID=UPI002FCEB8B2